MSSLKNCHHLNQFAVRDLVVAKTSRSYENIDQRDVRPGEGRCAVESYQALCKARELYSENKTMVP